MKKNTAGQKLCVFAFDRITNLPKTGDAANITAAQRIDFEEHFHALDDVHPDEDDPVLAPGHYTFNLLKGETNGDVIKRAAKSATANILVIPIPMIVETTSGVSVGGDCCGGLAALQAQYGNSLLEKLVLSLCPPGT